MLALLAAVAPSGAGAPIRDVALVGAIITVATVAMLAVVVRYRSGGLWSLRFAGELMTVFLRVPGWALIPGVLCIGAAVLTFMGAIWDIGVHIDDGRDTGPFGTTAHYPLLFGLVAIYLLGLLAVGMAPREAGEQSRAAVRLPALGPVPVGGVLILAGGAFAMIGFPLDDLWHRIFGQDVTLWGPTHTMFFGGVICAACGAVILVAEGARTLRFEPFGDWRFWRKPLAGVLGGIFLFVGTHATDEFNWGLPQYRQVWQPLLLMFFAALGLVVARGLGGRGATIGALAAYLPLQFIEVGLIGILGQTRPASVLYVAEALLVEAVAWRAGKGRTLRLRVGVAAGAAVGTVGFAAEYGWTQIAMPLPWRSALLPEAVPTALVAGVVGGLLAALMVQALTGGLARGRGPLVAAVAAVAVLLGLGLNAGIATAPETTATITLTGARQEVADGGHVTRVADVAVRLSRPGLARDPNWLYGLSWQGRGRAVTRFVRGADGSMRSVTPMPIGGTWKSFVRVHKGRVLLAAPVRMPADPALGFAGFRAERQVTRAMAADTKLLQIERKSDGPLWAWTPAMLVVMAMNLALMILVAWAAVRLGRTMPARPGRRRDGTAVSARPPRRGTVRAPRRRIAAAGR